MCLLERIERFEAFSQKWESDENITFLINNHNAKGNGKRLETSAQVKEVLEEEQKEGKLLRIGIVGRVKAGKSSLLNALVFDGEDVLPKAATPMTAALTIMTYSDEMRAEVEFFDEEDIDTLEKEYELQKKEFERFKQEEFDAEKTKKPERQNFEKALKRAERRKADTPYAASADQYERILDSGITDLSQLEEHSKIYADSMEELNHKLADFVGAKGKYMPLTKSVTLYLPQEQLKGLEIVDTPGINDPVQSREKRTEDLLSLCDVVLMISPTGQFLSEQDTSLMSRMTRFKGIGEVYLVASQCDTPLMGYEFTEPTIQERLTKIADTLRKHAESTLSKEKERYPEMEKIFE